MNKMTAKNKSPERNKNNRMVEKQLKLYFHQDYLNGRNLSRKIDENLKTFKMYVYQRVVVE